METRLTEYGPAIIAYAALVYVVGVLYLLRVARKQHRDNNSGLAVGVVIAFLWPIALPVAAAVWD